MLRVLANPSPATPTRTSGGMRYSRNASYFGTPNTGWGSRTPTPYGNPLFLDGDLGAVLRAQLGPALRTRLRLLLDLRGHKHERRAQRARHAVVGVADRHLG